MWRPIDKLVKVSVVQIFRKKTGLWQHLVLFINNLRARRFCLKNGFGCKTALLCVLYFSMMRSLSSLVASICFGFFILQLVFGRSYFLKIIVLWDQNSWSRVDFLIYTYKNRICIKSKHNKRPRYLKFDFFENNLETRDNINEKNNSCNTTKG